MMINRETATSYLEGIIDSCIFNEQLTSTLDEIRFCIEAERAGLHLWGASDEDLEIIAAQNETNSEKLDATLSKYIFGKSIAEKEK